MELLNYILQLLIVVDSHLCGLIVFLYTLFIFLLCCIFIDLKNTK